MTDEQAQDQIRTQRLAQLGTLLAALAHEVRNPLSTIGLNLQLVLEDFAAAESPRDRRTHKRIAVIESEVKRLQRILENFLGFVRSPAPQRRPVDLNALLQGLVELATPEMRARGIALRFFPGAGLGQLEVDADQIRAAVVNLLRNAQDACRVGDEVLLASRGAGDEVLIQVTDTGVGMSREVAERASAPYFSTKAGGTGLGLALVRRTLEEHGGRLEVSSEPGKGTQFTLRLPSRPAAAEAAP